MKKISSLCILFITTFLFAQEVDTAKDTIQIEKILVRGVRASKKSPFTKSKINKKELEKNNLAEDIPQLLNLLPSVVTTTDTGFGVGYSGIRVRGADASRTNVTINGIPLNDSESQAVFWVNMPDFVSSVESIQLQRGVGTSTNGAGAFGASLSLATESSKTEAFAQMDNSYGSFNTHKHNLKFGTGLINNHFTFTGRISTIQSDGYIDRASSNLKSAYLEANYFNDKTRVKALAFGGHEITYQAWYGIDRETLENDRTYNPAGEIYDDNGNLTGFYDNQVDNYKQDHYQLHINHKFNTNWSLNSALHYTYGRGYYEQYKQRESFNEYNFTPINIGGTVINETDLVRRKWLKNNFYGITSNVAHKTKKSKLLIGGAYNKYEGYHFGKVIWAAFGSTNNTARFYDNVGVKQDFNTYIKEEYNFNKRLSIFGDLQFRYIDYKVNGIDEGPSTISITDNFSFLNPKLGINYILNKNNSFYTSYARASKEPKRADYEGEEKPEAEHLNDFELGWRFRNAKSTINTNLYYMNYKNQLVLTGTLNDVGTPIAKNTGKSYRLGLEVDAKFNLTKKISIQPNIAFSSNKNVDKYESIDGILKDFGNTNLSFSPNIIIGNMITYQPINNFSASLSTKYVGEQFMNNIEHNIGKLDAYSFSNLQLQYQYKPSKILKEIVFKVLVNNILNKEYESNGYFYTYDDTWSNPGTITTIAGAGFYPQAGIHFLTGITIKF